MLSATASLGLVLLWDVDGGLTPIDKYLYSAEDYIKVSFCVHFNIIIVHPVCLFTMLDIYTVYTPRVLSVTSLRVSALLGHHQVTLVYIHDIKVIHIQRILCYNTLIKCRIAYIN
jgi:hypothetical protein